MWRYRNWSLKTRLAWIFLASAGSFLLFSIAVIHGSSQLTGLIQQLYDHPMVVSQASQETRAEIIRIGLAAIAVNFLLVIAFLATMKSFTGSINRLKNVMEESTLGGNLQEAEIIGNNEISDMALHYNVLVKELNRQMCRKDGLNDLSNKLVSCTNILDICQKSIGYISRYTNSGHGVFYLYRPEKEQLELVAAFAGSGKSPDVVKVGQGIIGQTALDKKPILIRDIREKNTTITTGTTEGTPLNAFAFPLVFEQELYGVIELASYEPLTEELQSFLNSAARIISTNLYAAVQNKRIQTLLDQSEGARKKAEELAGRLRKQSEELQEANTQLEQHHLMLQQQSEELILKNDQLMTKAEELELASGYKNKFLANMSHELRTPLNSIILLSKIMLESKNSNLSVKDKDKIRVINRAGTDLLLLINDILDISKIESGKVELKPVLFETEDFLTSLRELFTAFALKNNIEFIVCDQVKARIFVDREKLTRIVRNFLSNSFKFTERGSVSLKILSTGKDQYPVVIMVKDTGIGIPGEKMDRIFEAFKQVDESISRKYGGTGLGLHICRQLADKIGARIEVNSTPGAGSEFLLFLPAAVLHRNSEVYSFEGIKFERQQETAAANNHEIIPSLSFKGRTILIVDDDPKNIFVLAAALEEYEAEILEAVSCQDAMKILVSERIDLILMDIMMPGESGCDCIRRIRNNSSLKEIPIIAVTARALREDRAKCLQVGADDYISKPVNYLTLIKSVNNWLSKGSRYHHENSG